MQRKNPDGMLHLRVLHLRADFAKPHNKLDTAFLCFYIAL